ncbi:MAG: sirohydrochlorin cobaltochelatase [Clostridia bacterium]
MKAILVVSFGTSYKETRKVTIEATEKEIENQFKDYKIYKAWTSKKIIAKVLKTQNISVLTIKQAIEQMKQDGITDVIVQPTHIMNGIENDTMKTEVSLYKADFNSITFGNPLLTSWEDMDKSVEIMANEFADTNNDTAIVLMGHGTEHYANMAYAALDYNFKDKGYNRFFVGTVEAFPSAQNVMTAVTKSGYTKVMLTPFMLVAGDHANNDLIGDEDDSWKSQFENAGFQVSYRLKGLGEYADIRKIFVEHIKETQGRVYEH